MPHAKTDIHTNNENRGHPPLLPSKSLDDATRKHTSKKQAFGELKNVIHNQCPSKGVKSAEVPSEESDGLFQNACKEKNKHHDEVSDTPRPAKTFSARAAVKDDDIEMLNYFDFDRSCCRKPHKSDRQMWSEMNVFDDALLDNIIQGVFDRDRDEKTDDDHFDLDKSDSEDILDINNSKLFPAVFSAHDGSGSDDILLPPIQLEKFDFF